jgi:hypothetical protein
MFNKNRRMSTFKITPAQAGALWGRLVTYTSKNSLSTRSIKPSLQHFQFCRFGHSLEILFLSLLSQ